MTRTRVRSTAGGNGSGDGTIARQLASAAPSREAGSSSAPPPRPLDGVALLRLALSVLDEALKHLVGRERDAAIGSDPSLRGLVITDTEIDALLRTPRRAEPVVTGAPGESVAGRLWGRVADAMRAGRESASATPPALDVLRERFSLSTFELECLLACVAPEMDARYERLFGYLNDDVTRRTPSVQLLLRLFTPAGEDPIHYRKYLVADATLLRAGLLAPVTDARGGAQGATLTRCLRVENGVVRFLLDERGLDPELDEIWYQPSWPSAAGRLWDADAEGEREGEGQPAAPARAVAARSCARCADAPDRGGCMRRDARA